MQSQFQGIDNKEKLCFSQIYTQLILLDKIYSIVFTNYVLMGYGTGVSFWLSCMIKETLSLQKNTILNFKCNRTNPKQRTNLPYVDIEEDAKLVNSNFLNGLNPKRA